MFHQNSDRPPKRPIIGSQAGALNELKNWLKDNQFERLQDGDGLAWDMEIKVQQIPAKGDPKGLLWRLQLQLKREMTGEELVNARILQRPADERLLALIGSASLNMAIKPQVFEAANELEARRLLADHLPKLKAALVKKSLLTVKRGLVGRWVDEKSHFGNGVGGLATPET